MSGDVQPRKRKDKKRKKEENTEHVPLQPPSPTGAQNEDLNIHIHKEDGTGGGICAKIIFFLLFSALAVLIGLIITEHRGLTDLDVVETESRFSHLFEGWVDNSLSHDDDHGDDDHIVSSLEEEDHEESHEEEEEEEEEEEAEEEETEASEETTHAEEEEEEEEEEDEDEGEASEETPQTEEEEEEDESELKDADEEDEEQDVEKSVEEEEEEEQEDEDEEEEEKAVSEEVKEEEKEEEEEAAEEPEVEEKVEEEEVGDEQNSKSVNVREDNEPEESDSDKQSDYEYENITSKDDYQIKEKLDEAHKSIQNNTAYALKLFDALLQNYSSSPRSLYGKAQALDVLAEQKRSNELLQKAIDAYLKILELKDVPNVLFEAAAERCINRMRFIGNYNRAIEVHYKLIARFPQKTHHRNQLVVSLLTINRVNTARQILQETLSKNPNDGFALVHYGFILKTVDNNLNESISYLERGISTRAPGVVDGRFYFHLGDALARVGRTKDAMNVYQDGVRNNLFLSKYQRSLYNVARLKGQPWWKKEETPYLNLFQALETNWKQIRAEGISVLNKDGHFQAESENLKDTGDWKQFELFARGHKNINNCKKCPLTCKIIESVPDAKGCKRGQTKFSVMHPGTHVWPHCGPTNCRLRVHLGLQVPANTFIRVAEKTRSWKEGEVLVFDDSFEHEVWHNGTSLRLVLIVDVWHPELTPVEKRTLSPI
ncbi:aspartyl/asparaginyl beta-hydroxylase isoform X3 [Tribolium madens]|uniref:aspartyl/asparaginyl beta-hydroxylase isoform X3 n=1 Tax=Tribolium madens TaxID=41895 RepID=UPI001CF727F0|nr:aspartyl/asparaginyl beta-hydroxylase isoform X3 [Tribolium madens]